MITSTDLCLDEAQYTIRSYDQKATYFANRQCYLPTEEYLDKFLELLPREGKILDIGCGSGRDVEYFGRRGYKAIGIDLSVGMLDIARGIVKRNVICQMNMQQLGFGDLSFDGIWCWATFLHIPKRHAYEVLLEFHRVLGASGIISLTLKKGVGEQVQYESEVPRFFAYYQTEEITHLLTETHFSIRDIIEEKRFNQEWLKILAVTSGRKSY